MRYVTRSHSAAYGPRAERADQLISNDLATPIQQEDQIPYTEGVLSRADYIHARVRYAEGPQIPDPRAPTWSYAVERQLQLWQQIIEQ